ncbi:hypothetical protein CE91St36_03090 [Christensenellaceae bacterium]|nr:hypothetical protein CE91St36_03090 [Christensenellaceae bacterium]BDF60160.1 hypothetical protein CE91St37_03100 [Christensenellaceae bacterium]
MNIETVQKKRRELGLYGIGIDETIELIEKAKKRGVGFSYELAILAYAYGFIRGGNAERNKRKRG